MNLVILLLNIAGIYATVRYKNFFGNGYKHLTKRNANNAPRIGHVDPKSIMQKLDHFDPKENRTWKMMYYQNTKSWKPNGPIFLFMNGMSGEEGAYANTEDTYFQQLVTETNGAIFFTEHRYYDYSVPLDPSVTANLKYLTSQQALADAAYLIQYIKSSYKASNSKVVTIGGSYAGNLAVWMRMLYPNLVDAAVASSAPVLAKKDFSEFLEKVGDVYKNIGSKACYEKIAETFSRYDKLFETKEGIEQLKKERDICESSDMTKIENKQFFFMSVMYGYQAFAIDGTPDEINYTCNSVMDSGISDRQDSDSVKWCFDCDYYHWISRLKEEEVGYFSLPYMYQLCTEFGYFQSTDSNNHPFTNNVPGKFYYKWCTDLFGPEFDEARIDKGVEHTNEFYGGLKPNVTKVIFVNGGMDPWSPLGVLKDLSVDAPARVMAHANHCNEMHTPLLYHSQEVNETKIYIKQLVKQWIGIKN